MKLSILAPIFDHSSRGDLSRRFCLCLIRAGIDLEIKYLSETPDRVVEEPNMELLKSFTVSDFTAEEVISFNYPVLSAEYLRGCQRALKTAIYCTTTREGNFTNERDSIAYHNLPLVPGQSTANLLGIVAESLRVPVVDSDIQTKAVLDLKSLSDVSSPNPYVFYTIGRLTSTNMIKEIVLSYRLAFKGVKNVLLVLKTSGQNYTPQESATIQECIDGWSQEYGVLGPDSPQVAILNNLLDRKFMLALHKSGDCFIEPSRVVSNYSDALDARNFGNSVITHGLGDVVPGSVKCAYERTLVPTTSIVNYSAPTPLWWAGYRVESLAKKMKATLGAKNLGELPAAYKEKEVIEVCRALFNKHAWKAFS